VPVVISTDGSIVSTHRQPQQAPPAPGHLPEGAGRPRDPLRTTIGRTTTGPSRTDPAAYPALSATVAGFDGAVLATVSRHDESTPSGGVLAVVAVTGDLDRDSAPLLHDTLTAAIDGNPRVCCDLDEVTFFGAAGANTMLAAHWHAAAAGRYFTVRGVHGIARRVFGITGLDRVLIPNA
jgi:anti-anti-sigma factor